MNKKPDALRREQEKYDIPTCQVKRDGEVYLRIKLNIAMEYNSSNIKMFVFK